MTQQPMQQQYPQQYQQPISQQYAPPQGKSDLPMIVGAIVITIVVIIAAVLFVVFTSEDNGNKGGDGFEGSTTTPTGAFDFTEVNTGEYVGGIVSLSDDLPLSDCSVTIMDTSSGSSASSGPPLSERTISTGRGGLSLTYSDTNDNNKVDAGDVWTMDNAYRGDQMKLIHDTGATIAAYTIP
jgi:hypothetical protein